MALLSLRHSLSQIIVVHVYLLFMFIYCSCLSIVHVYLFSRILCEFVSKYKAEAVNQQFHADMMTKFIAETNKMNKMVGMRCFIHFFGDHVKHRRTTFLRIFVSRNGEIE